MKITKLKLIIWLLALLTLWAPLALAEEGAQGGGGDTPSTYMTTRQELWELKQKDPEAFRARVTELRNNAQKRLDELKTTDPNTYQRVIERRQKRIGPRFERFREQNPEVYQRIRQHRDGLIHNRVEWFRQNDPAGYQRIEERREYFRAARAQGRLQPGTHSEMLMESRSVESRSVEWRRRPGLADPRQGWSGQRQSDAGWRDEDSGGGRSDHPDYLENDRPGPRRGGPGRRDGR